jgi:MFS family permease
MTAAAAPRAAFQHRDFRLYLSARFLSNVGSQMMSVAVAWQVYAITHRAIDLGYVGLAQFVPAFAFSTVAGQLADRIDRGRIAATCNLVLAACALALLFLVLRPTHPVLPIYVVLFFIGVARSFAGPASQSFLPSLVPTEHFPNAVAWGSTVWQVSTIVGPSVGGVLYGVGASWVYGISAALMALASALVFAIRARPIVRRGDKEALSWETILAGFRYVKRHRVILGSVSLDLFAVLLGGATALLPVYASDYLHVGAMGLGVLRSAPAVGAAVTAIVLAYRPLVHRAGVTMLASVATFGVATVVFGVSRSFGVSLLALAILGASDMVSVMVRSTVVQLRTPHEMRGRVSAVNTMFIVASNELGEFESGITAAWLGPVAAVVVGGLGSILVVALYAVFFPELRAIDRLDDAA